MHKKIGDCCSSELGKTLDEGRNTGKYRPYLCALNVLWGKIDTTIIKQMRIEDEELNRYLVKKGDLLVCEGGEIGRCAIWDSDDEIYYQNALHRVRFYDDYDSTFFMYLLCYYNDLNLIEKFGKGLTIKHLNQASFRSIPVSVPSLPAQRRIAAILSAADKVIEQTRQLIGKYKSIKQGMMEDLLKPKEGWKKVKLGDCCIRLCNGMTYDIEERTGHLVTRIETISEGYIDYSKVGHTNYMPKQEYKLVKGDILFSHINSIKHIGKVAYYDDEIELYHGMNLLVIRTDNKIDSKYLFYQLTSENVRKEIRALAKSAVNQASINTTELQKFEINFPFKNDVPDLPEQRRIAKILSGIDRKIEAEEKVLEKYEKMKKGLMERLLEEE